MNNEIVKDTKMGKISGIIKRKLGAHRFSLKRGKSRMEWITCSAYPSIIVVPGERKHPDRIAQSGSDNINSLRQAFHNTRVCPCHHRHLQSQTQAFHPQVLSRRSSQASQTGLSKHNVSRSLQLFHFISL